MSYCFVRVTSNYSEHIKNFYSNNPNYVKKSYLEQYNLLINDSFESASVYSKNLNKIGVKAFDIISNAEPLQNTWKKENNLPIETSNKDIIIDQLKFYKPDVLWIDDFAIIDIDWKTKLLTQVPSIKLLVGHTCAPYNKAIEQKFKLFDIMFTCIPCQKNELEKLGIKTFLLYHGFEETILDRIKDNNNLPHTNFLFSGSLYTGSGFHKSRIEYIEKMLDTSIKIDLYCNLETKGKIAKKKLMYNLINFLRTIKLGKLVHKLPVIKNYISYGDIPIKQYSKKLIQSSKSPVFGLDMYKLLSKADICFNIHGEVAEKCAGNIRLFEATGVGSCLVTDWKENITDLFEPGKEIVTYKTIDECIDKVKWLINNPEERKKIALAGQQRTLKDHTIGDRVKRLNEILIKELNVLSK
ncbi:MAG: glycosyltransferase [Bacteroidota bacterium]